MQKKAFSVLKGPLLSEREVQTVFKAIEKFICVMYDTKRIYLNWPSTARYFLRKEKAKQKWQCLEKKIRKIDAGCLPPCFRVLQKTILWTAFVSNIWHNAFNSNTRTSLLENFWWKLVERKYKIQWFKGHVSPVSIESVCINNEEEENSDTEYESDSNIFWQWRRRIFQFS